MIDDGQLQFERGVNERYRVELRRRMEDDDLIIGQVTSQPRSAFWTGTQVGRRSTPIVQPLLGRVALDIDDPDLGQSFYVGSYYQHDGSTIVVSYAAPLASVFYFGPKGRHELAANVVARRTFERTDIDLVGYTDDVDRASGEDPFATTRGLAPVVPPAPGPIRRPITKPTPPAAEPESDMQPMDEPLASTPAVSVEAEVPLERAAELVMKAISAPRTGALHSLLATLQPDQYELVTWPDDRSLVVQGHPGTGKTVISVHRAAYLTHPERQTSGRWRHDGEVLVLGPSTRYVQHVRPIVTELAAGAVTVWSMPQLYAHLGGFPVADTAPRGSRVGTSVDPLGILVDRAAMEYRGPSSADEFVEWMIGPWLEKEVLPDDVTTFLQSIDEWDVAASRPELHPFLAAAGVAVEARLWAGRFQHIVIDEAQDLRPIDWRLVRTLIADNGRFTIVGDMQQRRSEHTFESWDEVVEHLDLGAAESPLQTIRTGYRSTNQILRFAGGVLSDSEPANALRDGPEPDVIRVSRSAVVTTAAERSREFARRHGGIVAVITCDPTPIRDHFRRSGLQMMQSRAAWREVGAPGVVMVSHPDDARGLEFDGVVVVEPADFPANLDRLGSLYTSLTRATNELTVVHSRALPGRLGRRRSGS